ncbi:MAG TPA: hypothetical protein VIM33_16370 [Gaiellaceae bacterium]
MVNPCTSVSYRGPEHFDGVSYFDVMVVEIESFLPRELTYVLAEMVAIHLLHATDS